MAIRIPPLSEGTRVRVRRANVPQDPGVTGRTGVVVEASEYTAHELGVLLDGEQSVRYFLPAELETTDLPPLPPEREAAKRRPALP